MRRPNAVVGEKGARRNLFRSRRIVVPIKHDGYCADDGPNTNFRTFSTRLLREGLVLARLDLPASDRPAPWGKR